MSKQHQAVQIARDLFKAGFVVLDLETEGLDTLDGIVSASVVDFRGNLVFHCLIESLEEITEENFCHQHGLTNETLMYAPMFSFACEPLLEILKKTTVVAYNVLFDNRLLSGNVNQYTLRVGHADYFKWQCAMQLYGAYNPRPGGKRWSLVDACAAEGISNDGAHGSIADAQRCRQLMYSIAMGSRLARYSNTTLVTPQIEFGFGQPGGCVTPPVVHATKEQETYVPLWDRPGYCESSIQSTVGSQLEEGDGI